MENRLAMATGEDLKEYLDEIDDAPPKHKTVEDLFQRFGPKQQPKAKA